MGKKGAGTEGIAVIEDIMDDALDRIKEETEDYPEIFLTIDGTSGSKMLEYEMANLLQRMFDIFKKKQASYGKHNIAKFGEKGVHIRMNDKMERLYNLVWIGKKNPLEDESIDDTYMDIADYAFIAMLVRHGVWDKI